jgi:deoxyribonuclease-4
VSRGLVKGGLRRADEIGAEAIQVFVGNPRGWAETPSDHDQEAEFRGGCADRNLPVFVHATYLINFGSPDELVRARSRGALAHTLVRAHGLGSSGVVLHAGSAVGGHPRAAALAQVRDELRAILDAVPGDVPVLIEPTAGGGTALAWNLDSTAEYLAELDDERVGLCLDLCHLFAAGHDLSTPKRMLATLAEAGDRFGRQRIRLIHANDSRDPVDSRRDRHASPGAGSIGAASFGALFRAPALTGVPLIVETADAEHAADIARLKELRRRQR